jgi:hypothetical protein
MPDLTSEERDRLWQHALHEDNLFNERLNSFVTFQSVLLALAALLVSSKTSDGKNLLRALGVAGLSTCIISVYVQAKQVHIVTLLTDRCRDALPEFRETLTLLESRRWRRVSSKILLAYFLPAIFALAWLSFLLL